MGMLSCYFRPKMFSPSDRVQYQPMPVMQTEDVQQFKVCYSGAQKFFTFPLDPQ